MQIRDDKMNEPNRRPAIQDDKGDSGLMTGIMRAVKILAFFVVLVFIFIASVMVVVMASGASVGSCSSGSQNPIV